MNRGITATANRMSVHDAFTLERSIAAAPPRVFEAFGDLEAKRRWFAGPEGTRDRLEALARSLEGRITAGGG